MSTVDSERAIDRTVATYKAHGENGDAYLLVALSILAGQAPEVLNFILDRADAAAQGWVA